MRFRRWIGHRRLRAFGAPIYVHWSAFFAAGVLGLMSIGDPLHAAIVIVSFFAIVVIHELGHAWVATRRDHEVVCIRISSFHGTCEYEMPDYEWDDVAIAWGGVLAQFAVAVPMILIQIFTTPQMLGAAGVATMMLGQVSIFVALINLIPARGLDGQKAWRVISLAREWWQSRRTTKRMLRKWTRR